MSTSSHEPFADAAGRLLASSLATLARLRHGKPVHPRGMVYEAALHIDGGQPLLLGASLLGRPGQHRALVRFSRSAGLPPRLPDAFGMAIRLPDVHGPERHQDFLLVTSADLPVLHHLLLPVADAQQTAYSSLLPYRFEGAPFLVGAKSAPGSPRPAGGNADERLQRAAATGRLRFVLTVAPVLGRFRAVGELRVGRRLDDALDATPFDPWNTGGGLEPAGVLNRIRRPAYARAQVARGARHDGCAASSQPR